jgi:site-specific DNA-methyltransferase (adenine-specific)
LQIDLHNGDCLELMKDIPDKSIDMILCDLPYGTTACKWDIVIPFDKLWFQYERIIKENGAIVLFGKQPFTTDLINSNRKLYKYELIWEKDKPTDFALANKKPMCYHENIEVFYKKHPVYNKQMVEREGKGVWRYKFDISHDNRTIHGTDRKYAGKKEKENYDVKLKNPKSILYYDTGKRQQLFHPTQKPVALFEYLIKTYTNDGETVLDNCMGSGTTAIACINTGRNFIGIELDEGYFDIAQKRIQAAQAANRR